MNTSFRSIGLFLVVASALLNQAVAEPPANTETPSAATVAAVLPAPNLSEVEQRARILHELISGSLQVMHRDLFDEDESLAIPSHSLEDVFSEMEESFQIEIRWMSVNTDALNTDHLPSDAFERQAAKVLASGKPHFAEAEAGRYRFAGPIRLASQCLKCHVQRRTSNEDRLAGLLISMPFKETPPAEKTESK